MTKSIFFSVLYMELAQSYTIGSFLRNGTMRYFGYFGEFSVFSH